MPRPAVMEQRKLLDALMGADRNGDLVEKDHTTKHYSDPDVCKNYLCGLCPHVLFENTKMDLGDCPLKHSEVLRVDYEMAKEKGDTPGYEQGLRRALKLHVGECDRKIAKGEQRLEAEAPKDQNTANMTSAIQALCAKAEELGEEGKIQESMDVFAQAEELKRKQQAGGEGGGSGSGGQQQQQQLRVCEVCAAFLSIYDSNRRLADHFGGKLHIGYLQMRERLKELDATLPPDDGRPPPPPRGIGLPPPPHMRPPPPRDDYRRRDDRRFDDRRNSRDNRDRDFDRDRHRRHRDRDSDRDRRYREVDRSRDDRDRGRRSYDRRERDRD